MSALPLTTTFTPPASCASIYTAASSYIYGPPKPFACFPSGSDFTTPSYFSPGVCPHNYALACSSIVGAETRGTCCPVNYTCNSTPNPALPSQCQSTLPTPQTTAVLSMITDPAFAPVTPSTETVTLGAGEVVNGYGVSIRFQSPVTNEPPSSTSYMQQTLTTPLIPPTFSPSTSQVPTEKGGGGGLSVGGKAAIGASIGAVGVIALVLMAVFLMRRREVGRDENKGEGKVDTVGEAKIGEGVYTPTEKVHGRPSGLG